MRRFLFFFKWNKTCNFCLTLPPPLPPLPPLRPPPPPLCSRLQLRSRCVSEPCTTTKQVGSHLGGNGNECLRCTIIAQRLAGLLPCYLGSLPCSRRGRIRDLVRARWHHQGRGDGGQSLVEGVEQRRPPRPVPRQLRGDHLDRWHRHRYTLRDTPLMYTP